MKEEEEEERVRRQREYSSEKETNGSTSTNFIAAATETATVGSVAVTLRAPIVACPIELVIHIKQQLPSSGYLHDRTCVGKIESLRKKLVVGKSHRTHGLPTTTSTNNLATLQLLRPIAYL